MFVLGGALVCSFFGLLGTSESLSNMAQFMGQAPWNLLFGIFFLFVSSLFIFLTVLSIRREQYIAFDNPSGEVTISVAAVEDFVYRTAKEFGELKEIHPTIRPKNEGVSIGMRAVFWSGVNIPEVTERIQSEIKKQVQSILGIENIVNVEIKVSKIESRGTEHLTPKTDLFEQEKF